MNEHKHTPGKLTVRTIDGSIGSIDHIDGTAIAQAFDIVLYGRKYTNDTYQDIRKANAARIVQCWNSHDDLLAALETLLAACEAVDDGYYPIEAIEKARTAIKNATSPSSAKPDVE